MAVSSWSNKNSNQSEPDLTDDCELNNPSDSKFYFALELDKIKQKKRKLFSSTPKWNRNNTVDIGFRTCQKTDWNTVLIFE
jgi:hypothetical protein